MKIGKGGLEQLIAVSEHSVIPIENITLRQDQQLVYTRDVGGYTVTLPPVGLCAGMVFSVSDINIAGTENITVHSTDSAGWVDKIITVDLGYCVLLSDGIRWIALAELLA